MAILFSWAIELSMETQNSVKQPIKYFNNVFMFNQAANYYLIFCLGSYVYSPRNHLRGQFFFHQPVGLRVIAEHKNMGTEFFKSPFLIEFNSLFIFFPNTQPYHFLFFFISYINTCLHQYTPYPFSN